MKISVIVPTYKPKEYLWECLESIYGQTLAKEEYELLLVLNGCKEPYDTDIKGWIEEHKDLCVRYFQTNQGGVSNARNIALDHAQGEYVTFIDDDDLISPKYLESLLTAATPDTISLCYPYAFKDGQREKQLPYGITTAYEYCLTHNYRSISSRVRKYFSGPWMKLIPMSFIQGRRFDPRFRNGEDSIFMFHISDRIRHTAIASRDAIYYRRYREGSAITSKRSMQEIVLNQLRLIAEYSRIFFTHLGHYNLLFYLTRVMGAVRGMSMPRTL